MKRAKVLLCAAIALDVTTAIGCSPSSNPGSPDGARPPGGDDGVFDGSADASDGTVGESCNPLRNTLCPRGQTCCFSGLQGVCAPVGSCHTAFQISCTSQADCSGGEACCGSGPGTNLALSCASACSADQFQLCRSDQECPAGTACVLAARGAATRICAALLLKDGSSDDATSVSDASGPEGGAANATPAAASTYGAIGVRGAAVGG